MIGQKVIIRTYSAGCFCGILKSRDGREVTLTESRRLWRWAGAATLSQLATVGTSAPDECKFPTAVKEQILTEAIEIIACTDEAWENIQKVPVWSA